MLALKITANRILSKHKIFGFFRKDSSLEPVHGRLPLTDLICIFVLEIDPKELKVIWKIFEGVVNEDS